MVSLSVFENACGTWSNTLTGATLRQVFLEDYLIISPTLWRLGRLLDGMTETETLELYQYCKKRLTSMPPIAILRQIIIDLRSLIKAEKARVAEEIHTRRLQEREERGQRMKELRSSPVLYLKNYYTRADADARDAHLRVIRDEEDRNRQWFEAWVPAEQLLHEHDIPL